MAEASKLRLSELDFEQLRSNFKNYLTSQEQFKDYDSTGILVKDDWQRVESAEELHQKITNSDYFTKYTQIHNTYKQSLLTKDQIYDTFETTLKRIING